MISHSFVLYRKRQVVNLWWHLILLSCSIIRNWNWERATSATLRLHRGYNLRGDRETTERPIPPTAQCPPSLSPSYPIGHQLLLPLNLVSMHIPSFLKAVVILIDLLWSLAVQWADLEVIDLSKAKTADGRAELVIKARDAMHTQGFFYVINHGLEKSQVCLYFSVLRRITILINMEWQTERIFDIAAVPFDGVTPEEQKAYVADMKAAGEFEGYKPLQYWASVWYIIRNIYIGSWHWLWTTAHR